MIEKRENGMREKPWQCQIRDDIEHYLPSQDEIRLMEDILNLTGVIFNCEPRWPDIQEAYRCIFAVRPLPLATLRLCNNSGHKKGNT